MPIGKSGRYHMNPHHMRAEGDAPDDKEISAGAREGHRAAGAKKGDGKHHHEMTKHEDGSYSSMHTHPDGRKEPAEHPDYKHAEAYQARMMEEEPTEHGEPDNEEGPSGGGESSGSSDYRELVDLLMKDRDAAREEAHALRVAIFPALARIGQPKAAPVEAKKEAAPEKPLSLNERIRNIWLNRKLSTREKMAEITRISNSRQTRIDAVNKMAENAEKANAEKAE